MRAGLGGFPSSVRNKIGTAPIVRFELPRQFHAEFGSQLTENNVIASAQKMFPDIVKIEFNAARGQFRNQHSSADQFTVDQNTVAIEIDKLDFVQSVH